jgi:hypothetical protein
MLGMANVHPTTRGTVGELLAAAQLLSLGVVVTKPYSDCVGVDLVAVSNDFKRAVPIQVKTAMSERQIKFVRGWFTIPGIVLVWVWPFEAKYFIFDGQADVERFLGSSAASTSWQTNGRWDISSTSFGPTHMERLKDFENAWDKVSTRLS